MIPNVDEWVRVGTFEGPEAIQKAKGVKPKPIHFRPNTRDRLRLDLIKETQGVTSDAAAIRLALDAWEVNQWLTGALVKGVLTFDDPAWQGTGEEGGFEGILTQVKEIENE